MSCPSVNEAGKQREQKGSTSSSSCQFATPLPQSPRSPVLEWRFPRPYQQYVLTGRSRAAWHTSFTIPKLNLLLDAGLIINDTRPRQIFLTHGHSDHTFVAPAFMKRDLPPDVYCPKEMVKVFDQYVAMKRLLNLGGLFRLEAEMEEEASGDSGSAGSDGNDVGKGDGIEKEEVDIDYANMRVGKKWLRSHRTHGLQAGDVVSLPLCKDITATAFACDHTVPCLGYVYSTTRDKLKPEYRSLKGPEIKALRESGVAVTAKQSSPIFAFLGDTTPATLAADPDWLRDGVSVVITECSFLYDEHRAQAVRTKHTLWGDLEPVVRRWPLTTFVLTHFSMRYSDNDVRNFFAAMEDPPTNIVVWADGIGDS